MSDTYAVFDNFIGQFLIKNFIWHLPVEISSQFLVSSGYKKTLL